jgi:cytoskeletal protein CcmA (bactofilin family)
MARISQAAHEHRLDSASLPEVGRMFPAQHRNTTVVVSTWLTKTKLSSAEGLVIEGLLECDMAHHQQHLTVSRNARVTANLSARTVVVFGQLTGDIFSDGTVWLARGSDVRGDIHSACLFIEEGAQFSGQIETGECATHMNVEYS